MNVELQKSLNYSEFDCIECELIELPIDVNKYE